MIKRRNIYTFILFSAIKSFVISLILTIALSFILGYRYVLVNGWSSEPVIPYHSIIMIHKVSADELKVGDYVTFSMTGEGKITHRISSIDSENGKYTCYANTIDPDTGEIVNTGSPQIITIDQIQGKVFHSNYVIGEFIFGIRGNIQTLQKQPFILVGLLGSFVLLLLVKEKCDVRPEFVRG